MAWLIESYLNENERRDNMNATQRYTDSKQQKEKALHNKIYNSQGAKNAENDAIENGEDPQVAKAIYAHKTLNDIYDKTAEYNNAFSQLSRRNKHYYPTDSLVKSVRRRNEKQK